MILFLARITIHKNHLIFILGQKNRRLELKTFDIEAGTNFDVANFEAFCSLLEKDATFIDSDYLIFAYSLTNGILKIKKVFLKKVWEICCGSSNYPVKTQIKRGMIYNIRPSIWLSDKTQYKTFTNCKDFIFALYNTLLTYKKTKKTHQKIG